MTEIPINVDEVIRLIRQEVKDIQERVLNGACTTYDDYRYQSGILIGMDRSLGILIDYANRQLKELR